MPRFAELAGQGDFPFQAQYDATARQLDAVQGLANAGLYGAFDSGVLNQTVRPNSEFLQGGQFFDQFAGLLTSQDEPTEEALFDLGVEVGTSIKEQALSPRGLVLGYLSTELQMAALRVGITGPDRGNWSRTQIVRGVARMIVAESLPFDAKTRSLFRVLAESFATVRAIDPQNEDVFALLSSRLDELCSVYGQAADVYSYVAEHYSTHGGLPEQGQNVDRGINLLSQAAMRERKYGTKPAYIEASTGGSWVFYDGEAVLEALRAKSGDRAVANIPPFAAMVIHVREQDLSAIDLSIEGLHLGERHLSRHGSEGLRAAHPEFVLTIHHNGSITIDPQGLQPIQTIMAGNPDAGRRMLAEVASCFYDLSRPINVDAHSAPRNYTQMTASEREAFDPITQLLVPRLRYLETPREEEPHEPTRTVRRHDVTWYVRPIPEGWHASPDAVKLATEVGVVLGPHETFVKRHERGLGHGVLGHHIVRRVTDLTPGRDY